MGINYDKKTVSNITNKATESVKTAYGAVTDVFNDVGNYFSNRRIPNGSVEEDVTGLSTNAITFEHLDIIGTLPPKFDNIVDPPLETNGEDFEYKLSTLFQPNRRSAVVGRAYTKNFLMNGNFVTFVPIQLDISYVDSGRMILDRQVGSVAGKAFDSLKSMNPMTMWDTFSSTIDIGGYGYRTKIAGKMYWKHVAANMKVILYALGIDVQRSIHDASIPTDYVLNNTLPDWIVNSLNNNTFYESWRITDDSGVSETDRLIEATASNEDRGKYNANKRISKSLEGGSSILNNWTQRELEKQNKNIRSLQDENADLVEKYSSTKIGQLEMLKIENELMRASSKKLLRKWILAAPQNKDATIQDDLPLITFYVNGSIEKSYGASQSMGESELGSVIAGSFAKEFGTKIAKNIKGMSKDGGKFGTVMSVLESGMGSNIPSEIGYATGEFVGDAFTNAYVPRINKGVDGEISYSFSLRSIADGSDPVSLAMHLYNIAKLTPFYVEPASKAFTNAFVPKSPLLVSAFSKGIFNIPKGVITNIDIKTDPVFQTTESISTDLEINITITPLISKGFAPDFAGFFSKGTADEANLLLAMFNPFSSFNLLITMCGMNTTMTTINKNIFMYFFETKVTSIGAMAIDSYQGFKSQLIDLKSTTVKNMSLAKAVRTN